jgi:predicted ATPase
MAKLTISSFLSLQSAEIEVDRLNVFIGPQAQGKSLVVKLIYYFESMVRDALLEAVPGDRSLSALRKENLERFQDYFPKYAWGARGFEIRYEHESICIEIKRKGGRSNNPATLTLSPEFEDLLKELQRRYEMLEAESDMAVQRITLPARLRRRRNLFNILSRTPSLNRFIVNSVFIPASRAFFANVEKNVFTLISNRFEIDRFMAEFGSTLERIRQSLLDQRRSRGRKKPTVRESGWNQIIRGDYVFDDDEELVEMDYGSVRLSNSSSGQQEAIPLLLVLSHTELLGLRGAMGMFAAGKFADSANVVIEEPEAHLFPRAQSEMARFVTRVLNTNPNNRAAFTTHSPYMLTAMNNLAFAGKIYGSLEEGDPIRNTLTKVIPEELTLVPNQMRAYKVEDGTIKSIVDQQTGLINAYLVDQVSEEFGAEFTKLLEIEAAVQKRAR